MAGAVKGKSWLVSVASEDLIEVAYESAEPKICTVKMCFAEGSAREVAQRSQFPLPIEVIASIGR